MLREWYPPKAIDAFRTTRGFVASIQFQRKFKSDVIHWQQQSGAFAGQECHVLGNGPSLTDLELSHLSHEHVITMNAFGMHPRSREVTPLYHCIADPPIGDTPWESIQALIHLNLVPSNSRNIVVHPRVKAALMSTPEMPLWAVNMQRSWPRVANKREVRLDFGIGPCQSTAILAISLGLHLGFQTIFLYGMEHSFLADPERSTGKARPPKHFYADVDHERLVGQFSHARHLERYTNPPARSYSQHIATISTLFQQHEYLAQIARKSGIRIINRTPRSFLDTYST